MAAAVLLLCHVSFIFKISWQFPSQSCNPFFLPSPSINHLHASWKGKGSGRKEGGEVGIGKKESQHMFFDPCCSPLYPPPIGVACVHYLPWPTSCTSPGTVTNPHQSCVPSLAHLASCTPPCTLPDPCHPPTQTHTQCTWPAQHHSHAPKHWPGII